MKSRSDGTTIADEWFADYLARLSRSRDRVSRLRLEGFGMPPADEIARRDYDEQTEMRRRMLQHTRDVKHTREKV
ncbi:tRNA A58 N-methylase Trm61 [Microbacterium marinum]|uniref:tRNA A58 N-methylase Trm61 n=1 Tax=Microbacterium marinum TaxID=421115 RepID=A0A7W7BQH6_9MICO|nr:hypothetical protein [Microbacterium marinum]MBB4666957.1 tRNA A58 N-methylase Trm61 [Microbacterium marinum]